MLERYEMIRTGRLAADNEHFIRERPGSDAVLSFGLTAYSITANSDFPAPPGDTTAQATERLLGMLDGVFETVASPEAGPLLGHFSYFFEAFPAIAEKYSEQLPTESGAETSEFLKAVGQRYRRDHPQVDATHLGELLPHFPEPQKLTRIIRLAFAELGHFQAYKKVAPDAAALTPFLEKPFDLNAACRVIKVTFTNDSWSLSLDWNSSDVRTGLIPRPVSPATAP